MRGLTRIISVLVVAAAIAPVPTAAQDRDIAETGKREVVQPVPFNRFDGRIQLAKRPMHAKVRTWIIHHRDLVERLPESGLLLCELRAGVKMDTIIDGNRQERKEGDIWTVPAGKAMSIVTGRYSVVLQTISLSAPD